MAKHRWCHKPFVRLSMLSRPLHGKILQFRLPVRLKQLSARIFFPLRQSVSSLSLEMGLEYRDHAYQLLLLRRTTPSSMNNAFLREIDMQITKCTYVHVPFSISLSLFLSLSLCLSLFLYSCAVSGPCGFGSVGSASLFSSLSRIHRSTKKTNNTTSTIL